jgi:hypothetical protein
LGTIALSIDSNPGTQMSATASIAAKARSTAAGEYLY